MHPESRPLSFGKVLIGQIQQLPLKFQSSTNLEILCSILDILNEDFFPLGICSADKIVLFVNHELCFQFSARASFLLNLWNQTAEESNLGSRHYFKKILRYLIPTDISWV